ncbi:hypothetical protein CDD83_3070 [Cordyceps sp. RAO-2017]|nr:hypothetical protein CDD83_3070 [Cordyceps sp. RAO-2017]
MDNGDAAHLTHRPTARTLPRPSRPGLVVAGRSARRAGQTEGPRAGCRAGVSSRPSPALPVAARLPPFLSPEDGQGEKAPRRLRPVVAAGLGTRARIPSPAVGWMEAWSPGHDDDGSPDNSTKTSPPFFSSLSRSPGTAHQIHSSFPPRPPPCLPSRLLLSLTLPVSLLDGIPAVHLPSSSPLPLGSLACLSVRVPFVWPLRAGMGPVIYRANGGDGIRPCKHARALHA